MYTQCSQCHTTHRVGARALSTAFGQVRCMRCGAVFNALDALADELREDGRFPPQFHSEQPPVLQNPKASGEFADDELTLDIANTASKPTRRASDHRAPPLSRWWAVGSGLLAVALLVQLVLGEQQWLRTDPRARPLLERFCKTFGCTVEQPRALDQITLVNREIRPHPVAEGALLITATIQNRAAFAQAYPQIGITLSDLNNRVVAERFFTPKEYLQTSANIDDGLAADTLLPIEFEVSDPGRNALAFEFSFR